MLSTRPATAPSLEPEGEGILTLTPVVPGCMPPAFFLRDRGSSQELPPAPPTHTQTHQCPPPNPHLTRLHRLLKLTVPRPHALEPGWASSLGLSTEGAPHQPSYPGQAESGRGPEEWWVGREARLQGAACRTPAGPLRPEREGAGQQVGALASDQRLHHLSCSVHASTEEDGSDEGQVCRRLWQSYPSGSLSVRAQNLKSGSTTQEL